MAAKKKELLEKYNNLLAEKQRLLDAMTKMKKDKGAEIQSSASGVATTAATTISDEKTEQSTKSISQNHVGSTKSTGGSKDYSALKDSVVKIYNEIALLSKDVSNESDLKKIKTLKGILDQKMELMDLKEDDILRENSIKMANGPTN